MRKKLLFFLSIFIIYTSINNLNSLPNSTIAKFCSYFCSFSGITSVCSGIDTKINETCQSDNDLFRLSVGFGIIFLKLGYDYYQCYKFAKFNEQHTNYAQPQGFDQISTIGSEAGA